MTIRSCWCSPEASPGLTTASWNPSGGGTAENDYRHIPTLPASSLGMRRRNRVVLWLSEGICDGFARVC